MDSWPPNPASLCFPVSLCDETNVRELDFFWQNSLPVGFPLRNEKKVCTWFRGFFFDQIALCLFSINDQIKRVFVSKKGR